MTHVTTLPRRRNQDETPPVSPQRAALAERIRANAAADDRLVSLTKAAQSATSAVYAARRSVEDAEAGIAQAKIDAGSFLGDVAQGIAGARPVTIREAKTALADAQDELDAAIAARDAITAQTHEAGQYPSIHRHLLHEAALAVLKAEAKAQAKSLADDVDAAQRDLAEKGAALAWLVDAGILARSPLGFLEDGKVSGALSRLSAPAWSDLAAEQSAGRSRWEHVLQGLMTDATTPVPE